MSGKRQSGFFSIGSSSLLVVFLVLCLAMFAALCLSGAAADSAYSTRQAQRRGLYYDACNTAELLLDDIDARLEQAARTGGAPELSGLPVTVQGDVLSFETPINQREVLSVSLTLTPDGPHYYEITAWQTVTVAEWHDGAPLNLMNPGGNAA